MKTYWWPGPSPDWPRKFQFVSNTNITTGQSNYVKLGWRGGITQQKEIHLTLLGMSKIIYLSESCYNSSALLLVFQKISQKV